MRSFAIAAFVAAANAFPAPYGPIAAVTVTEVTDVYTTVYADEPAAPATPVAAATTYKYKNWKPKTSDAAPVVVVSETPSATTPAYTEPAPTTPAYTEPAPTTPAYTEPAPTTAAATTPAASPPPPASTSAAASAAAKAPNDYAQIVVDHHNAHRANHSAPALVWDAGLAATALKIAQSCKYAHDTQMDGGGYGQNIAAGCPASNVSSVITELFYNNEVGNFASMYGQATPANINDETAFDGWGHFTQIVWKGTTSVGCATYHCDGGLANTGGSVSPDFTVCNYKSPGNYLGEFATNVLPSIGKASIGWNSV